MSLSPLQPDLRHATELLQCLTETFLPISECSTQDFERQEKKFSCASHLLIFRYHRIVSEPDLLVSSTYQPSTPLELY